jgi:hypothetical protein
LAPGEFQSEQILSHGQCVDAECRAFETSPTTYQKRHAVECSSNQLCRLVGIDTARLASIVEQHALPLVRSTVSQAGFSMEVVDDMGVQDFAAISHVWAGGLGNFDGNEIYECQALYLHAAMRRSRPMKGTVHYWLDTLCIPVHDPALRKAAIDEMAQVYASTGDVLVLDPVLGHTAASGLD